jgi:hypothetical protein
MVWICLARSITNILVAGTAAAASTAATVLTPTTRRNSKWKEGEVSTVKLSVLTAAPQDPGVQ